MSFVLAIQSAVDTTLPLPVISVYYNTTMVFMINQNCCLRWPEYAVFFSEKVGY